MICATAVEKTEASYRRDGLLLDFHARCSLKNESLKEVHLHQACV
jgi:hypothetical protein